MALDGAGFEVSAPTPHEMAILAGYARQASIHAASRWWGLKIAVSCAFQADAGSRMPYRCHKRLYFPRWVRSQAMIDPADTAFWRSVAALIEAT